LARGVASVFSCAAVLVQPCAAQWEFTGSVNAPRFYHTATLLSRVSLFPFVGVD